MELVPFVSIGQLRFGDTRQSIRQLLGGGYESFKKVAGANDTDTFDKLGLHLYFDDGDRLEYAETFEPARPSLRGITMVGRDIDEVIADLRRCGYTCSAADDVSMICQDAGVCLYVPSGVVEAVGVFRRGYHDRPGPANVA